VGGVTVKIRKATGIAIIILFVIACCGCDIASIKDFIEERVTWFNRETALYITSTYTGRIYRYDFDTRTAEIWFSTGENGTGAIYFHNDVGYVAVGTATGSHPGLYRFDPRLKTPTISRIGNAISAQYVAFYSDTKAYVTDHTLPDITGVYTFNPSDPGAGLSERISGTDATSGRMLQDIIVGVDNQIYVSSYGDDTVLQIAPSTDSVEDTWNLSPNNPDGLLSRFSGFSAYIYVVCNPGGVYRFTPAGSSTNMVTGISASKMVYHEKTNKYYAVGWGNTYVLSPTSPTWTPTEITDGGTSFGGSDILIHNDLVFIVGHNPATKESHLYMIDTATAALTSHSPVSIMEYGVDGASNLAVY
jgi:hypothetical protein